MKLSDKMNCQKCDLINKCEVANAEYIKRYEYYESLFNNINKPKHYTKYKKEVIDIIKDCLTDEEFKGYLKGNIIKYRMRAGLKDDRDQDLAKSNYYQDRLKGIE